MSALNLVYVIKDGVFDCYNLITGRIGKKYVATSVLPKIDDAVQSNCILVLASHCDSSGNITYQNKKRTVSAYAELVLKSIKDANKINKIVYFACSASVGVTAILGKGQLAPTATLALISGNLKVDNYSAISPKSAILQSADGEGWSWTGG